MELTNIEITFWEDLITGFHLEIDGQIQFYYDKNIFIENKNLSHKEILQYLLSLGLKLNNE